MSAEPILSVRDLVVDFELPDGPVRVIDGISFDVYPNEVLCIVGESSSGKSVTMLAVIGLLPRSGRVVSGEVMFQGRDLLGMSDSELQKLRGGKLAMIFQDPLTSLNPVVKVGSQIGEMITLHQSGLGRSTVRDKVVQQLKEVGVPNAEARYSSYPHQFSGGMRQRAMIAMAMANNPALLVADEPTTALDVTIQAQVLEVLRQMQERHGSALVLITHDLGVVAETAHRVVVMYCGRIVESGSVEQIFSDPRHPYTAGLMASLLRIDAEIGEPYMIAGQPPVAARRPSGCPFHPRCGLAQAPSCTETIPTLKSRGGGHQVACHFHEETPAWIARELPQIDTGAQEVPS